MDQHDPISPSWFAPANGDAVASLPSGHSIHVNLTSS
jgi:hypothetical protein